MIDLGDPTTWRNRLHGWRFVAGKTQAEFAAELGITSRAYQDLESGKTTLKRRDMLAVEFIGLRYAVEAGQPEFASPLGRATALDLAAAIRGA